MSDSITFSLAELEFRQVHIYVDIVLVTSTEDFSYLGGFGGGGGGGDQGTHSKEGKKVFLLTVSMQFPGINAFSKHFQLFF